MNLGIGIFNARVAGNIANDDILGSMEFACKVAAESRPGDGPYIVCVMKRRLFDNAELGYLTDLNSPKTRLVVQATAFGGERSAKNLAYVDAVARKNVELTMVDIPGRARCSAIST